MTSASPSGRVDTETGVRGTSTTSDRRVRSTVVSGFAWTVGVAGLVWGTIYVALGLPVAALYPYGFTAISVVNLLAHRRHRNLRLLSCIEMFAILLAPAALAMHLGGFVASGAVGLWSLLAPIGALLVIGPRFAMAIFAAFVALTGLALWADGSYTPVETITSGARDVFLFLNVTGVSVVAFWALALFIAANERLGVEQARLREIERSYVAQESMLRQRERLATLGRLSAGIAHELNNPAAAAGRATSHLGEVVNRLVDDAIALLRLGVGPEGLAWVWSMVDEEAATDPIDVADREDGLVTWLESRSVGEPWDLAGALAELGLDAGVLNQAAERYSERQIVGAVKWIADVARGRRLIGEVRTSTGRISDIVGALKGYSHMDGAGTVDVDVVAGIEDTLIILKNQLTGITVERRFDPSLPRITGNPGELNQVWTNLLANATEALDGEGTIVIAAHAVDGAVRVEIEDDGPGIPTEIVESVFEPFVTTKAPGEGTGLGLSLTHQIVVDRHHGRITVESNPGRTRFVVALPVGDPSSATVGRDEAEVVR